MATQADIDRLRQTLQEISDPARLQDLLQDAQGLLESLSRSIDRAAEDDVREYLRDLKVNAEELCVDIKKKLLEVKADHVDPQFFRRRTEEWEDESRQFADEMSKLPGALGEGIVGIIRSLAQAVEPHIRPLSPPKCPECGAELVPEAKFCPQCGAAIPEQPKCPSCGATVDLSFKFCPRCGTRLK